VRKHDRIHFRLVSHGLGNAIVDPQEKKSDIRFCITISNLQSQVTAFVRNYIAENDQYCLGSADDGPNSQKATGYIGTDCWTYGITSKRPAGAITCIQFLLFPRLEATLHSACIRMTNVGTYGLLNSAGDCIYSGATPDSFRSYKFDAS
jgi:hypothetical protein